MLDNDARVFAFTADTGSKLWEVNTGGEGNLHVITYYGGSLYVATGHKSTVMSIDASDGSINWESPLLGEEELGFHVVNPPIVWKNYVIAGSAGGNLPGHEGFVLGNVTALSRVDGHVIWSLRLTQGDWVAPGKVPPNGAATDWSGGSFDPQTGLMYIPAGNSTPDFNATSMPEPNLYANHMVATHNTSGLLKWATPFIAQGTSLSGVTPPDTHDYDTS